MGDWDALRRRFAAHGQDHVFRFWDELEPSERDMLASQCEALDLGALDAALADIREAPEAPPELAVAGAEGRRSLLPRFLCQTNLRQI